MSRGMKCENCGKGIMIGHNVSHAKNRTRKIFKPNLHSARILVGTNRKKMKLCTKCLRTVKRDGKKQTSIVTPSVPTAAAAQI